MLQVPRTRTEEEWTLKLLDESDVLVQPGFFFDFESEAFLVVEPPAGARHVRGRREPPAEHHIIAGNGPKTDCARWCSCSRCWRASGRKSQRRASSCSPSTTSCAGRSSTAIRRRTCAGRAITSASTSSGSRPAILSISRWIPGWSRATAAIRASSATKTPGSRLPFRAIRRATANARSTSRTATFFCTTSPPTKPGSSPKPRMWRAPRSSRRTKSAWRSRAAETCTFWT